MIAKTAYHISRPSQNEHLLLAPFDATHLQDALPLPTDLLLHQPATSEYLYRTDDPTRLMYAELAHRRKTSWGIFVPPADGDILPGALPPQAFLGIVSACNRRFKGPDVEEPPKAKELSAMLFRPDERAKGIGSLVVEGLTKELLKRTPILYADTSPQNPATRKPLERAGYTNLGFMGRVMKATSGYDMMLNRWQLVTRAALNAVYSDSPRYAELHEGLLNHKRAAKGITVQRVPIRRDSGDTQSA